MVKEENDRFNNHKHSKYSIVRHISSKDVDNFIVNDSHQELK